MIKKAPLNFEASESPPNGRAYWVQANDGVRLRIGVWKTKTSHKGTVFLFPGRSEYLERFGRTVTELHKSGFSTIAIDWRGHGLSDRVAADPRTCHVDLFTDYQKDVAAMVTAAEDLDLPKPWFLFGNSMGGSIGLRAIIEGLPVTSSAFTSPMWNIKMSPVLRCVAWPLSWAAQSVGKGQMFTPGYDGQSYALKNPFNGNRATSDEEAYQFLISLAQTLPELEVGGVSMGWLFQGLKESRSLSKLSSPDIPCISFLW